MTAIAKLRNGKTATITSVNGLIHGYINGRYHKLHDKWWDLSGLALFENVLEHPRGDDIINLDEVIEAMSQQQSFCVKTTTVSGRAVVITDVILEPARALPFDVKPFKGYRIFEQGSLPDKLMPLSWCYDGCLRPYTVHGDTTDLSDPNAVYEQFKAAGRVTEYVCPLEDEKFTSASVITVPDSTQFSWFSFLQGVVLTVLVALWVIYVCPANSN